MFGYGEQSMSLPATTHSSAITLSSVGGIFLTPCRPLSCHVMPQDDGRTILLLSKRQKQPWAFSWECPLRQPLATPSPALRITSTSSPRDLPSVSCSTAPGTKQCWQRRNQGPHLTTLDDTLLSPAGTTASSLQSPPPTLHLPQQRGLLNDGWAPSCSATTYAMRQSSYSWPLPSPPPRPPQQHLDLASQVTTDPS